jgi:flagellar biogenesis protein FliO
MQGSGIMPRTAKILIALLWGILLGTAQAQLSPTRELADDPQPYREPSPAPRFSSGDQWTPPAADEPQALSNQGIAVRHDPQNVPPPKPLNCDAAEEAEKFPSDDENRPDELEQPSCKPLPIPPAPPKSDEMVTPVSYQENASPQNDQPDHDEASTSGKSSASRVEKTPLVPQSHKSKTPLPPSSSSNGSGKSPGGLPSMISVAGSTGVVLGIFLLFAWIVKSKTPQAHVRLPAEAFEVLGRAPIHGRQQVQLLRCGAKVILVSVTPAGAETLTEITDPAEVDRLCGLCRSSQPGSSTAAFKHIFEQLAPRKPGKIDSYRDDELHLARSYGRGGRQWEDRDV